jgi:hypothetical protein
MLFNCPEPKVCAWRRRFLWKPMRFPGGKCVWLETIETRYTITGLHTATVEYRTRDGLTKTEHETYAPEW